ncbi:MAG: Uma2 family endonuclease [Chloroflexota bacterium]
MVTKPEHSNITIEEWLAHEQATGIKHEYIDGEIYAMSGGTLRHARLIQRCMKTLDNQIDNDTCEVLPGELRIRITATKYVYPDAIVVCGEPNIADDDVSALTNPTLIVEVTSPSSRSYDRGLKAEYYYNVSSVQAYLVVEQSRPYATLFLRKANAWEVTYYDGRDAIVPIAPLDSKLSLADIYEGISFEDA